MECPAEEEQQNKHNKPEFDIADESTFEEHEDPMFERIISRLFQKLKPDCRMVLTLYADGHSYKEIAATNAPEK